MTKIAFDFCGFPVRVEALDEVSQRKLRAYFGPCLRSDDCEPHWEFSLSEKNVAQVAGPACEIAKVEPSFFSLTLTLLAALSTAASCDVLIHAACVIYDETLVVLVAPSGGGKSALTRASLERGAVYVSDDMIRIADGRVFGLARAIRHEHISLKPGLVHPSYLSTMDLDSLRYERDGPRTIPIWYNGAEVRCGFSVPQHVVVVRVQQGNRDELTSMNGLSRLVVLHEAAIVGDSGKEYDGSLGDGPAYELSWSDPLAAIALLFAELRRLKQ